MNTNKTIFIVIIIALAAGALVYSMFKSSEPSLDSTSTSTSDIQSNTNQIPKEVMDQLKIEDLTIGTGDEAKDGQLVTVNYVGTLDNGTKFDSSYDRGTPFQFVLGTGMVIPGWDLGVKSMKVGGKRRLTIPAELGYGAQGAGAVIPPNATLHFDVELLGVKAAQPAP